MNTPLGTPDIFGRKYSRYLCLHDYIGTNSYFYDTGTIQVC